MRENFDPSFNDNNIQERLAKLENMFFNRASYYFDISEWESIIDYYLDILEPDKASKAIVLAQNQHPSSIELDIKKAEILIEENQFDNALAILKKNEIDHPFNANIYLAIGDVFSRQLEHHNAIVHYRKALELIYDSKEDIYLQIATECQSSGKLSLSIYWLKILLNEYPENIESLYELAFSFETNESQEEGIHFFKQFIEKNPSNNHAWFNLGNLYTALESLPKALNAFEHAVESFDEFSSGWFNQGNILGQMGRHKEAIKAFEKTLELEGPSAQTYFYIGDCYEQLQKFGKAKIAYVKALELDDQHIDAWIGSANCYLELGDGQEAYNYCKKALKLDAENALIHYLLGDICKTLNYFEEAKSAYENVIKLDESNHEVYLDYSDLLFCNEEKEAALILLEHGINTFNHQSDLMYRLGTYHFLMGKKNNAFEQWTNATIINDKQKQSIFEYCPQLIANIEIQDFFS